MPSSTRFCRPIHLQFKKEITELSQREHERILELNPLNITLDIVYEMDTASPRKDNVKVTYDLALTMVDQKVINALTETASTVRCYICKATPKMFTDIQSLPRPANEPNYKYGLCPLHKWIRCFEMMMIQISYRLPVKKWRVTSQEDKTLVA